MKQFGKYVPFFMLLMAVAISSCTSEQSSENIDTSFDFTKTSKETVIVANTNFNEYTINYGFDEEDFSFKKNGNEMTWKWSSETPLNVTQGTYSDSSLLLSTTEDGMDFEYNIKSISVIDDNTLEIIQVLDDGSLNTINVQTPFSTSGFNTHQLLGDHILTDSYVNSKIVQKCPPCYVVVVFLIVVSDSDERKDDNCAENNRAVERNCMNREDKCLENHGPCDLRCVSC
jgi:hypothetical protein